MIYPDYWLCIRCKKSYKEHTKIGEPDGPNRATHEWCLKWDSDFHYPQDGWYFTPIDNLSMVEYEAKQKGL